MQRGGLHASSVSGGRSAPLLSMRARAASDPGDASSDSSAASSSSRYAQAAAAAALEAEAATAAAAAAAVAADAEAAEASHIAAAAEAAALSVPVPVLLPAPAPAADDDDEMVGMINILGRYRGVTRGTPTPPTPPPPYALRGLREDLRGPPTAEEQSCGSDDSALARHASSSSQSSSITCRRSRASDTPTPLQSRPVLTAAGAGLLQLPPTLSHQPLPAPRPLPPPQHLAAPQWHSPHTHVVDHARFSPALGVRASLVGANGIGSGGGDVGAAPPDSHLPEQWLPTVASAGSRRAVSVTSSDVSARRRSAGPETPDAVRFVRDGPEFPSTVARSRSGSLAGQGHTPSWATHQSPALSSTPNSTIGKNVTSGTLSPLFRRPTPATTELTFLECVVELLRGTTCLKRKNMLQVYSGHIWLSPDMTCVRYRYKPKKGLPVEDEFEMAKVRKIKSADREIAVMVEEKKTVEFIFSTRETACVWLSGLACLIPSRASIRTKNQSSKHVAEYRENYDPLLDSWNGKPLIERKTFKQYILLGSIGRGAFGKVKLALSRTDRQFYAVKCLSKAMLRKQNRNSAFDRISLPESGFNSDSDAALDLQEVNVMRTLDHPNIVKLIDTHDDAEDDRLHIVVEFAACGPVMNSSKLQGENPMERDQVWGVFMDAVEGLMYLHRHGVVHRDFKPENLLQFGDGTAKISDFGSACRYDESAASSEAVPFNAHRAAVGTPAFTAPELCLSEKSPPTPPIPYASDIWSLGATLFYMWHGRAPFLAKSVFEMYEEICTKELRFDPPSDAPPSLQALLLMILTKDPNRRATFADILASAWVRENARGKGQERLAKLRGEALKRP